MSDLKRFGRRFALPSTRQIRHELLQLIHKDELQKAVKADSPEVSTTTDKSTTASQV